MFPLAVLFGSNWNSYTVSTHSGLCVCACARVCVCVCVHILHNMETLVGEKEVKIWRHQSVQCAKEIFPCAIGPAALVQWKVFRYCWQAVNCGQLTDRHSRLLYGRPINQVPEPTQCTDNLPLRLTLTDLQLTSSNVPPLLHTNSGHAKQLI
jgi:hypothetical protein